MTADRIGEPRQRGKNRKRWRKGAAVFFAALVLIGLLFAGNRSLGVTTHSLTFSSLPEDFHGYRIVHLSDLHGTSFGKNQKRLLDKVALLQPDMVVMTGDLVDQYQEGFTDALFLMEELSKNYPTLFVEGNHETAFKEYEALRHALIASGVVVLENQTMTMVRGTSSIAVSGVRDIESTQGGFFRSLETMAEGEDRFHVLLSHRPELFDVYAEAGYALVLSGHTHGGQFRIPVLGGVLSPGLGFFPRFSAGVYEGRATRMVVSRGLGNSRIPLRVNNPPEVVLVELLHGLAEEGEE